MQKMRSNTAQKTYPQKEVEKLVERALSFFIARLPPLLSALLTSQRLGLQLRRICG